MRPPSPAHLSPQAPAVACRGGGTTSSRARFPSRPLSGGTSAEDDSVAAGDAEAVAQFNADVVDKKKRSIASVRAGLTEQRVQSVNLAWQVAAGMTKVDQLTVAHESAAADRAADQAAMTVIMPPLSEIKDIVASTDSDSETEDDEDDENRDAWVGLLKARLLSV